MAELRPSLAECSGLIKPLQAGERRVAEALQELSEGWTVYVQPRLGMDMPDFVAVHDEFGVCVIEVKDWTAGQYRRRGRQLQHRSKSGWQTCTEHPLMQAYRYQSAVFERHFAFPDDAKQAPPSVRSMVILLNHTDGAARELLKPSPKAKWDAVQVYGDVACFDLEAAVCRRSSVPPARSMERLRASLDDGVSVKRYELSGMALRGKAARVAADPPEHTRRRRVRGPAGSGKSLGLAHRAAVVAAEGKSVLVVCFNVTLAHYLRSLVTKSCAQHDALPSRVQCIHFHGFRSQVRRGQAGLFDAILVDEGQDFTLAWWQELERSLAPGGEMLIVVDQTQNIYGTTAWTDEQMTGAGFTGAWMTFDKSYRLPPDVVPILADYAHRYLDGEVWTPEVVEERRSARPTERRWLNVKHRKQMPDEMARMVIEMLDAGLAEHPSDVAFLCETHRDGLAVVERLEARGLAVNHLFAESKEEQRRAKLRFWPGGEGVRGSTVHSFKGWESQAVVLGIGDAKRSRRLAYVAMSRLLVDPYGIDRSAIGVVNANARLNGFRNTFKHGVNREAPTSAGQVA